MLPALPGSVSRIACGATGAVDPGGTHQFRHSTSTVAIPPGGTASSTLSGGTTVGNAGGCTGSGCWRCWGAGTAPTATASGRPASAQALVPLFRNVTRPVPPDAVGANSNPPP